MNIKLGVFCLVVIVMPAVLPSDTGLLSKTNKALNDYVKQGLKDPLGSKQSVKKIKQKNYQNSIVNVAPDREKNTNNNNDVSVRITEQVPALSVQSLVQSHSGKSNSGNVIVQVELQEISSDKIDTDTMPIQNVGRNNLLFQFAMRNRLDAFHKQVDEGLERVGNAVLAQTVSNYKQQSADDINWVDNFRLFTLQNLQEEASFLRQHGCHINEGDFEYLQQSCHAVTKLTQEKLNTRRLISLTVNANKLYQEIGQLSVLYVGRRNIQIPDHHKNIIHLTAQQLSDYEQELTSIPRNAQGYGFAQGSLNLVKEHLNSLSKLL
ncbi:MAG: hypothetical protein CL947_00040 [Epsilonproteobacteria bacterium]|nr:hypothetical protein [Campylobacterota bacterium]|tara:strand:+ start:1015 stop:1977 length:963 start_codon:yes stop_codon:yes gene_type:complete